MIYKITYILFLISFLSFSQVGINTTSPNPSSIMDISASDKGLLIPRVSLTGVTDTVTIQSPAIGLLVYKTGASIMPEGFYYWNGTQWQYLLTDEKEFWSLTGNTINNSTDALGTNNSRSLLFKTNNEIVAQLHPSGSVVIGLGGSAAELNAIAIGRSATATSDQNIAIGFGSVASGENTIALGVFASSAGSNGTAVGTNSAADGKNATAFGHLAKANGEEAVAIGGGSGANELSAVALGPYSKATAEKSFALGPNTEASALNSFALGIGAKADTENTVIIGEVQEVGEVDITPVNVGIGTKTPAARIDVHGKFKLGEKGNVLKGISGFTENITTETIGGNGTVIETFAIPSEIQPTTAAATINATMSNDIDDAVEIVWVKLSAASIRVKFRNDSGAQVSLSSPSIHFSIIEF